ncbi:MAG TPA: hypothetical protein VHA56_00350 [Mucilaginibacter sp.]|nr:hypothetical protein [Mucilaginibacter sp.]
MKKYLSLLALPLLLAACHSRELSPGTYVNHAESDFSVADDTLIIQADRRVIRHTGYYRKTDKVPHHLDRSFTGVWDGEKQTLTISKTGAVIQFRDSGLVMGNSLYRKL